MESLTWSLRFMAYFRNLFGKIFPQEAGDEGQEFRLGVAERASDDVGPDFIGGLGLLLLHHRRTAGRL